MKRQCKFGPTCNKFSQGQDCGFLHDQGGSMPPPSFNPGPGFGSGMGGGGSRPCKFGDQCNQYKMGRCTFLHQGGQNTGGFNPGPSNPPTGGSIGAPCKFGDQCNNHKQGRCRFQHNAPQSLMGSMSLEGPKGPQQPLGVGQVASIEQTFCKNFQLNRCQNQHCKRLHRFSTDDSVKRLIQTTELPAVFNSNVVWLSKGGTNYLPLKMGNRVLFYTYNPENNQVQELSFTHDNDQEIMFFRCEQENLLYSSENPVNKLWNISIFNLEQQRCYTIANAHQKTITGLTMVGQSNLVSVSYDGFVKIWKFNTAKGEFEIESGLTGTILSRLEGAVYQFTFCKVFFVANIQTLWVGTRCGKLLVFNISSGLELMAQVVVPKYVIIQDLDIKLFKNGITLGFLLGWAEDKSSAILKLDMNTLTTAEMLTEKVEILKFMVCESHLAYGTSTGSLYIHKLPSLERIGWIGHNNEVLDIVYMETMTNTLITFRNMVVLEARRKEVKDEKGKGSFSIYKVD